eukprot:TRINITY_DN61647_c0_g1_i1.p1 TRINITY_DN61647_c0_g1~~TRINITY_DN61647_c0_g1_i1.p1  ORF type:complete len:601 (+),score=59.75 TRINITY_DN61647_c0_g1_i1:29-1804(+)
MVSEDAEGDDAKYKSTLPSRNGQECCEHLSVALLEAIREDLVATKASICDHVSAMRAEICMHIDKDGTQRCRSSASTGLGESLLEPSTRTELERDADGINQTSYRDKERRIEELETLSHKRCSPTFTSASGFNPHVHGKPSSVLISKVRSIRGFPNPGKLEMWIKRWESMEEPERSGLVARVVDSMLFEMFYAAVILLNLISIMNRFNQLHDEKEHVESRYTDLLFLLAFLVELVLKLAVHGLYFFVGNAAFWNWFDVGLVWAQIVDYAVEVFSSTPGKARGPVASTLRFVRYLKLLRLTRILRLSKSVRTMLDTLFGSSVALFWSAFMIFVVCFIFGIIFAQYSAIWLSHFGEGNDATQGVLNRFGSIPTATFTLYLVTTGGTDWGDVYDDVAVVGVIGRALFIFFTGFTQLALFNVVTGLYVDASMKYGKPSKSDHVSDLLNDHFDAYQYLTALIEERIVRDDPTTISASELASGLKLEDVRTELIAHGIEVRNVTLLFHQLTEGKHDRVDICSFVGFCLKLRGIAHNVDVQMLTFHVNLCFEKMLKSEEHIVSEIAELKSSMRTGFASLRVPTDEGRRPSRCTRCWNL